MASILSNIPLVGWLLASSKQPSTVNVPPVEVHSIAEGNIDRRRRTLRHLLRANHVNHSILYHDLRFHNHLPHLLASSYHLGALTQQLYHLYDEEAKTLEPWKDSPHEISRDEWRDFLGARHFQRAWVDFFDDQLAMKFGWNWKNLMEEYMFQGDEPLINSLISGLGHPLIHLGYAYEFDSREVATEALGLAATCYDFLHKYVDDPAYTRKAPFSSRSPLELLDKLAADNRFASFSVKPYSEATFDSFESLFGAHEEELLEYWNAWDLPASDSDITMQFRESQEAAVAIHAVRILLPMVPAKFHVSLVRQWWLLALAVYVSVGRPKIDLDLIPGDLGALRAMREAANTWGDVHEKYLAAAIRFADDFKGWVF
ncbi:uncharacterized protein CTHT_0003080 [Thermochaetoides thermophila DSM 1495]|uniref:MGS207 protein n=1 Tax=Chaetomium thermophilum (strain DSM 1495 / CBS 144.50 / IMI 039719) TaxID=759272 RepID=G0RZI5_CHATD|nr:hypothetical protein CTHT_0003080 [Thermochaetoides thermophila DSM 1495]EGS23613.1 hypothetical protein CTHT_0003080 [Thermochaetoides thermophila DSM 1495]